MPRTFNIPSQYHSGLLSQIKKARSTNDPKKRDKSPTTLELGPISLKFARHFGFCFGVENAIEIAYSAIDENPGKRIFLLSEMIHNPHVNEDLQERGVRFLYTPLGEECFPISDVTADDIVIIPAFGTTLEMFSQLEDIGVDVQQYNTTCPFVEKVWKRGSQLGAKDFSVIIHGKALHEETRATFSHASSDAPSLVLADVVEAQWLASFINGEYPESEFFEKFDGRLSDSFSPSRDLSRIGVINQTTMLATETWEISQVLKKAMEVKYGAESITEHFADTRDTLCYATSENQDATKELIGSGGDLALIVGGYNSSNTSHLVELCEEHFPSFFVSGPKDLLSVDRISHLDLDTWNVVESEGWFPFSKLENVETTGKRSPVEIVITSGASCPDALVHAVVLRLLELLKIPAERYLLAAEQFLGELDNDSDLAPDSLKVLT